jgi:hypothetical protein
VCQWRTVLYYVCISVDKYLVYLSPLCDLSTCSLLLYIVYIVFVIIHCYALFYIINSILIDWLIGWCFTLHIKKGLMIPKWSKTGNQIRTDNTMAIRYQRGNQKPGIEEEQTIQWPKDTKGVIRSRESKDRQYNGQKILKG